MEVRETVCPGLGGQRCQLVIARAQSGAGRRPPRGAAAERHRLRPGPRPGRRHPRDRGRRSRRPERRRVAGPALLVLRLPARPADARAGADRSWRSCCCSPRLRGALSLVGLGFSLAVVLLFVVPAILDGKSPLAVAIVGGLAIALITIPLAHGAGPKSLAALLGTAASLLLTALLALRLHEGRPPHRHLERGGHVPPAGRRRPLARGAAAGRDGDRRAGRARRRDREPGVDGAGAARGQPGAALPRAVRRRRCGSGATTSARP